MRIKIEGNAYNGKGTSTDTIKASAKSYLQAINFYESLKNKSDVFETITEKV